MHLWAGNDKTASLHTKIRYPLSGRLRIFTTITNTWKIMDITFQLFLQSVRRLETSRRRTKISLCGRNLNNYSLFNSSYLSFLLRIAPLYFSSSPFQNLWHGTLNCSCCSCNGIGHFARADTYFQGNHSCNHSTPFTQILFLAMLTKK